MAKYGLSLFVFRRDLRLEDNTALIAALKNSDSVIPCFIFDPRQCEYNAYKSLPALQFMIESLIDLQEQFKKYQANLYLFYGKAEEVIEQLIQKQKIHAVYFNRDYTPFSLKRDKAIAAACANFSVGLHTFDDALLNAPEEVLKADETPYQIFTRYYQQAQKFHVLSPAKNSNKNYFKNKIVQAQDTSLFDKILPNKIMSLAEKGGRAACLRKLKNLTYLNSYDSDHDFPNKDMTTHLSAHLKFTTCSVREIYHSLQTSLSAPASIIRQLYWRDFFTMIGFHFPHVFGQAYRRKYNNIDWDNNEKFFQAWCEGLTGFPIVDAGMRQLKQTGYMHNRVRLLTGSFLVKDLHIDWRWGEKYFAQKLIDYDPAVNNGNWQWVAGTGTDAQPYFRIFNPWTQQVKFDPNCEYIKHWIPELKNIDNKTINQWYNNGGLNFNSYPSPIINHAKSAILAKKKYLNL